MTGRTVAEKIIGRAAGTTEARAGEVVEAYPDILMSHENTYLVGKAFREIGVKKLHDPDRVAVVLDHRTPANTVETAVAHSHIRKMVKDLGIRHFYDVGTGICHQILIEEHLAKPGQLVVGTDSHTSTAGAVGAFATGIGATEMAGAWATGYLWLKVPETVRVHMRGHLEKAVFPKDVSLHMASKMGPSGAEYRCIEFDGIFLFDISISGRMVLCNMATELGAKAAITPADSTFSTWSPEHCGPLGHNCKSDEDARFIERLDLDVEKIPPMVSGPDRIEAAGPVDRFQGVEVDQAFIGTCTNGRLEDLIAASWVLKGNKVAPGVRLLVAPASRNVLTTAMDMGVIQTIVAAGGTILPPGCGPCLGAHGGVMGPNEVCISSGNRNFKGRMGSGEAEVYIASPATVAASAITGKITDPRGWLTVDL